MISHLLFTLAKNMCMKCKHIFAGLSTKPPRFFAKMQYSGEFSPRKYKHFRKRIRKRCILSPIEEESIPECVHDVSITIAKKSVSHQRLNGLRLKLLHRLLSIYRNEVLKNFIFSIASKMKRNRSRRQVDFTSLATELTHK